MKIMLIIPKMTNGGAERVAANLCNYWCNSHEVRVVSIASKKSFYKLDSRIELCGQEININRKNIFTTVASYFKYFFRSKRFIKENVKEFNPDCVISLLVEADYLTYCATKKNKNIIKVFSERADPTRRNKVRQWMAKRAYTICDLFVCQSQKICEYYSFISKDKKVVIPNPLDAVVLPKPELKEKNHNIVAVGRLSDQKNHALLIKSFITAINRLPSDCNLIIYGDGPLKSKLQVFIDGNKMRERIKLAGVSKDLLNDIKNSALFVLSSNYEGFPNALLEAMAVGLPVISTDFYTGVAKELIGKENGIVVPVEATGSLTEAIVNIMKDSTARKIMRKKNIEVRKIFDIEKIGQAWIDNIQKIRERRLYEK